jgi:hypothetical protein
MMADEDLVRESFEEVQVSVCCARRSSESQHGRWKARESLARCE